MRSTTARRCARLGKVRARSKGADLDLQAKTLQAAALRRIDGPDLRLSGFLGRVSTSVNLDTSAIANAANPILDNLPAIPGLNLPEIPNAIGADRIVNLRSLGLSSVWPLYTGGRLQAVREIAAGRASEARRRLADQRRRDRQPAGAALFFGAAGARGAAPAPGRPRRVCRAPGHGRQARTHRPDLESGAAQRRRGDGQCHARSGQG
ncbi:hypothetical protein LP420_09935 [Massilia sp. B-10]|nr:hypothetical protein LP420_09935 [Massilia sp. B-10]